MERQGIPISVTTLKNIKAERDPESCHAFVADRHQKTLPVISEASIEMVHLRGMKSST